MEATAFEVLFGGAAGGGKSYGQMVDALLYALRYPASKQLILRRTLRELDHSLIRAMYTLYPQDIYCYSQSSHCGEFANGSLLDFGYCDSQNDVYKYQSAEYDVIRFDELTHFTEEMYLYLMSRIRGANPYPKQVKSSTNPGGVGHAWVKSRFIDICPPNEEYTAKEGSRIFIPSRLADNPFLTEQDPDYLKRLLNLSATDQKALLYGDWNIFEGQYFDEWDGELHVIPPFIIPKHWRRYFAMDYGLDMLAGYFIALDTFGRAYVYKEIYRSGLIVSEAARVIRAYTNEELTSHFAPPDLYSRCSDSGKSIAELFCEEGVPLLRVNNDRVQGWYNLKEWLKPSLDERGERCARLRIFSNCTNLIRTLPALQRDKKNPNDCAPEPHEITHAPDAIRYFVAGQPMGTAEALPAAPYQFASERPAANPLGVGQRMQII